MPGKKNLPSYINGFGASLFRPNNHWRNKFSAVFDMMPHSSVENATLFRQPFFTLEIPISPRGKHETSPNNGRMFLKRTRGRKEIVHRSSHFYSGTFLIAVSGRHKHGYSCVWLSAAVAITNRILLFGKNIGDDGKNTGATMRRTSLAPKTFFSSFQSATIKTFRG